LIFSGVLSRAAGSSEPVRIDLDGDRRQELFLEIDEGDNEPLHLERAQALVRVPRVVFKLKPEPGEYRLLLGNHQALAPHYDIESLRREVLAYSAVPIQLKPLARNPAYRRRAVDYFTGAPQTALLWTALVIAVAALLLLTARLLKKQPTE
jgi:hypothetical protein